MTYRKVRQRYKEFCSLRTIRDLSLALDIPEYVLRIQAIQPGYDVFHIRKSAGGKRLIENPSPVLKAIQRKLNRFLQSVYYIHKTEAAYGFIINVKNRNPLILSFDLIEPFRPICDAFVFTLFTTQQIASSYFDKSKKGIYLNRKAKQKLIPLFLDYLDQPVLFDEAKASYKNHIYRYADQLRQIIEKLDLDDLTSKLRH